jgi:hypothetical protein
MIVAASPESSSGCGGKVAAAMGSFSLPSPAFAPPWAYRPGVRGAFACPRPRSQRKGRSSRMITYILSRVSRVLREALISVTPTSPPDHHKPYWLHRPRERHPPSRPCKFTHSSAAVARLCFHSYFVRAVPCCNGVGSIRQIPISEAFSGDSAENRAVFA